MSNSSLVVVTGANGFVGARVCAALLERGATVRGVVRREGTAPQGVEERVGEFTEPAVAADVVAGSDAVVTTVHPMGSDQATQHSIGVEGTAALAREAAAAGVRRVVHVSTCAVYDRSPGVGDVDESSALVGDDAGAYAVTKRDADAALAEVDGITRLLVRPPAILGPGDTSIWNTLRPAAMRDDAGQRHAVPEMTFAWVHVDDLATIIADLATGGLVADDGGCTPVNVSGGSATQRDYYAAVTGALGVDPVWDDDPAWTGAIRTDRAESWGWAPEIGLDRALEELRAGISRPTP